MKNEQLDVLITEYNNSSAEYLEVLSEYRKQINLLNYYITVFTGVIIVLFYTLKENDSIRTLPISNEYIFALTLTFSIALLYYIYTNAIDIVYNLYLVEAKRAVLEQRINGIIGDPDLLNWDHKVVRHFNEGLVYRLGWLNPSILTGVAGGIIVIVITVIHCVLAYLLIPTLDFKNYFTIVVWLISSFLLHQFVILHMSGKKYIFDYVYSENPIRFRRTKAMFSVVYFAIATFILGPFAFIIWSLRENAFWNNGGVDLPFLVVWPLSIGDVFLLPVINYMIANLGLNVLEVAGIRRNTKLLTGSLIWIAILSIVASSVSHYAWATDRYTDFVAIVPGKMTVGGWWHWGFSIIQTFVFGVFFVLWRIAVVEKANKAMAYASKVWWLTVAFLSLMIVNTIQQYLLVHDGQGSETLISIAFTSLPLATVILLRFYVTQNRPA